MAQTLDFNLPYNSLIQYVPQNLRNQAIKGLIDNLFDRFMTRNESIPFYGYVGRKPKVATKLSPVPQASIERDINAVIPVFNFVLGSKKYTFTVQDILTRAAAIEIGSEKLDWFYSQANNYLPPIDIDRFANFYNYFWVAKALKAKPELSWNPELEPEYYTIAAPKSNDLIKANVVVATTNQITLTGTGFLDQAFTVAFTSPTTFTITPSAALGNYTAISTAFTLTAQTQDFIFTISDGNQNVDLFKFTVIRDPIFDSGGAQVGYESFEAGDTFIIDTTFLSSTYSIAFTGTPGIKGKIANVQALSVYQTVDGVVLKEGQRVLVKNNQPDQNGIYVVMPQAWVRASDYTGANIVPGAQVWASSGIVNGGRLFTSAGDGTSWPQGVVAENNTNDWQEGNFWLHFSEVEAQGLSRGLVTQATRPIIEFHAGLQLNSKIVNGLPSDQGSTSYRQTKSEFAQLPLFDLFRYDGTHANLISSVFYYEEDLTGDLDVVLQKRVKISKNDSADFIFNHGLVDATGHLLFYKDNNELKTIWHAGYSSPEVVDQVFNSDTPLGKGTLTAVVPSSKTQQQIWTLTATSPTTFSITGSKTISVPAPFDVINVGANYVNDEFACKIEAGSVAFEVGDNFVFRIGNLEFPKYVFRNEAGQFEELYGGIENDTDKIGAYEVPRPYVLNPYNENRDEVLEGSLYTHFRGIIQSQPKNAVADFAFGGNIKSWSEQQTLFASLMMQDDLTPISMIDFAQRQYENSTNAVVDIFRHEIAQYLNDNGTISGSSVEQQAKITKLVNAILAKRASSVDVKAVLFDTTSPVIGFPATLPQLGVLPLVEPTIEFNGLLNQNVLLNHDGHSSSLFIDNVDFRRSIFNDGGTLTVTRSDGAITPAIGSTSTVPPVNPYMTEFWLRPEGSTTALYTFDVDSDLDAPLNAKVGTSWFNRTAGPTGTLFLWDGGTWVAQPSSISRWHKIDLADLLNQILLNIESRLYAGINPNARKVDFTPLFNAQGFKDKLERELFIFAANNGLDPLGSDYDPANAFTWNYSAAPSSVFAPLSTGVPARWYNILLSHQATVPGVIPTEYPNVEPWKLFGFGTKDSWMDSPLYKPEYTVEGLVTLHNNGIVKAVKTEYSPTNLVGPTVIDGITLVAGDRVLLSNEIGPENNGIWIVSNTSWTRATMTLFVGSFVTVQQGLNYAQTVWTLTQTVTVIDAEPVLFKQVRPWTDLLWADLKAFRPQLRLSVDTKRDTMLPPYVSSSLAQSQNALTTSIPPTPARGYAFLEGSPVETVWVNTVDYKYSLARALFKYDPLYFLGFCWGYNWIEVDGVLYDGYDITIPGHKRFKLHGDQVVQLERNSNTFKISNATGWTNIDLTVEYDAYEVQNGARYQNFSVKNTATGAVIGYVREGQAPVDLISTTIQVFGLQINDFGQPFRIGDKFRIIGEADGSNIQVSFIQSPTYKFLGFGQIFTNALRSTSIDTNNGYAIQAYRGWNVNMGYRAGGLVATDDLKVRTETSTLPSTAFELIFKKNSGAKNIWAQALRVTVSQFGSATELDGIYKPKSDGSDWVFRIEGYNPRYPNIEYYLFDEYGSYETFNVLDKTATSTVWKHFTDQISTIKSYLPITITGIQNVATFLFGYTQKLSDDGWAFNEDPATNTDAETGRSRTWQLEIEKFIDRCYRGLKVGQGHVMNPFMDGLSVRQDTGLISSFVDRPLFDINAMPAVFDVAGIKISAVDLDVIRGNQISNFSATTPIYSAHAQLDEYEHLFVFDYFVENSSQTGLLYQPFTGSRVATYLFDGRKQASQTFRPEFGGHYLVGNEVRQNPQASTDSLADYYNANTVFENSKSTEHALALLGFNSKEYFDDLDVSKKTQFNFWRGLIQSKGTNMSVGAFLNNDRFADAKIDEYWAYKIAEYGDARQRTFPELKIQVADSIQQFTLFQFDAVEVLPNFTQISRFDESRWFGIDDLNHDTSFKAEIVGVFNKDIANSSEQILLPFISEKIVAKVNVSAIKVRAATTGDIQLTGPNIIDGIELYDDWIVLVKDQIDLTQNGLYKVSTLADWERAVDYATAETLSNVTVVVDQGVDNAGKYFFQQGVINSVGVDPITFVEFQESSVVVSDINAQTKIITRPANAVKLDISLTGYGPATPRYNPVKLFNFAANTLISEIPLWNPAVGQHTPAALESINIISTQNPAKYNFSTQVINNNTYDPLRPWGLNEVGRVWFDTRNLSYIPYYDTTIFPNLAERLSRWGALADFASIDVYEWVRSTVPPTEYNALALQQAGNAELTSELKAAGEVALQELYVRDRSWQIRPIAWSFSPTPIEAAHPAFNNSFDALLYTNTNSTLMSLDRGLFSDFGITSGMRIGAWNNDSDDLRPLSESIITGTFTKLLVDAAGQPIEPFINVTSPSNTLPCQVEVTVESHQPISGQLLFSEQITEVIQRSNADGSMIDVWDVTASIKVTEVDSGKSEIVVISKAVGTDAGLPYIAPNPGQPFIEAVAGQEFRPAREAVSHIDPVQGQPFIAGVAGIPPTDPIPGGPAKLEILFSTELTNQSTTGLALNTLYVFQISVNGITPFTIVYVNGDDAQTIGDLINAVNANFPGDPKPILALVAGNLLFTSSTVGSSSTIELGPDGVFSALPGFDSYGVALPGTNQIPGDPGTPAVPEQPYRADFAGRTAVEADPGQPFIAAVAGQVYIPPTPEQLAVAPAYLHGATVDFIAGESLKYTATAFGLDITVTVTADSLQPADVVMKAIAASLGSKITVRDAAEVSDVVPIGSAQLPLPEELSNDPGDMSQNGVVGWRAWNVPSQAELSADTYQPNSSWKPYFGQFVQHPTISSEEIKLADTYSKTPLTLNNGETIQRYTTDWSVWRVLKNEILTGVQIVSGPFTLTHTTKFDAAITAVYINGIAQLKASYTIIGNLLTVDYMAAGSMITVIIRKYEPTVEELNFNPAITENLLFQSQYKKDFEYVSMPVRDSSGNLGSPVYYFWVKNKSIPAPSKKLSIQAIVSELRDGPANFLTFQHLIGSGTPQDLFRYDAITLSGLSYIVAKDDTFKLRFTRDFTLRDDPQNLDLKDYHAEWSLMRKNQRTKVPESLWNKMVDSAAGADGVGNSVPSLRRVMYDERNGTKTQFGFDKEQTLAPRELLVSSITNAIVNTQLENTFVPMNEAGKYPPDFIEFLNFDESDMWFATAEATRKTLTEIWLRAKASQINEIFFAAMDDILASNFELSDIFKTSRLSAYAIKVVSAPPASPSYE